MIGTGAGSLALTRLRPISVRTPVSGPMEGPGACGAKKVIQLPPGICVVYILLPFGILVFRAPGEVLANREAVN